MDSLGCQGGDSCCNEDNKCREDEGDCDQDTDCKEGLKCGTNNCSQKSLFEWDPDDDCCYKDFDGMQPFSLKNMNINSLALAEFTF